MRTRMRNTFGIVHILEIRSEAGTNTRFLGGGVDGYEDEVSLVDTLVYVGGKEQVATPCLTHNFLKAWFINWKREVLAIPRVNTRLIEVDDSNLNVRAFKGNYSTRRSTWVHTTNDTYLSPMLHTNKYVA